MDPALLHVKPSRRNESNTPVWRTHFGSFPLVLKRSVLLAMVLVNFFMNWGVASLQLLVSDGQLSTCCKD